MNIKNTKYLYKKYPKLFRQKNLSIQESCMPWGFECGDGWFFIIDKLCSQLQWDIDHNKQPQLEFIQVKEKFGSLRLYNSGATEQQEGMISLVEYLSNFICEDCGSTDNVKQSKGWIYTRCEKCRKKK